MVRRSKAFTLHLRASLSGPFLPFLPHCPLPSGSLLCNSTKCLRVCEYTGHAITTGFAQVPSAWMVLAHIIHLPPPSLMHELPAVHGVVQEGDPGQGVHWP